MTQQTQFPNPPEGRIGLLCYDSVTDAWYAVLGDADGHIIIEVSELALPTGAATSANQDTMITALQAIDDLRNALGSVATDNLQVLVTSSALPSGAAASSYQVSMITALNSLLTELQLKADLSETQPVFAASLPLPSGAATSAKQDTIITAVEKIDDLQNALGSVNTDDLQVDVKTMPTTTVQAAGGDKIFSFESIIEEAKENTNLGAGTNTLDGTPVPAGKVWRIDNANIRYDGTSPTRILIVAAGLATALILNQEFAPTSGRWYFWTGSVYLQAGDTISAYVYGATAGDDLLLRYAGVQMDAP